MFATPGTRPAPPVSDVQEDLRALPIGQVNSGDLRFSSFPQDNSKAGLLAIGEYSRTRVSPLPDLYDRALNRTIVRGSTELIGRLPDDHTPLEIMRFTIRGHQLNIEIGLSPVRSAKSNYLWGGLPKDLQPGVYHVQLTAYEVEMQDGHYVRAPAFRLQAFYNQECYFFVPQDFATEQTWKAQDDAVKSAFDILHERLRFLENEVPRTDQNPTLYRALQYTAARDLTSDGWTIEHYWNPDAPGQHPINANTGLRFNVSAWRFNDSLKPAELIQWHSPIQWNGTDDLRNYALDNQEFGWKFHVYVKGSDPEIVKNINAILDQCVNDLATDLRSARAGHN